MRKLIVPIFVAAFCCGSLFCGRSFGDNILDRGPLHDELSQNLTSEHMSAGSNDTNHSQSSHPSRWTLSAEAIVFDRIGTAKQTLVERVPGVVPFGNVPFVPATEALNSRDLDQGFSPGFRVDVDYRINSKYDLDLSFFRIGDWDATQSIGPDHPPNWLVMKAPGGFFQTQDFSYQSMTWDYSSELHNAELNVRRKFSNRITLLAGFRWLQLNENLQGTIQPPDRSLPLWKFNLNNNLFDVARIENQQSIPSPALPPFWNTSTTNNLYGLQIGADAKIFEHGRFSLDGLIKVGGYCNNASESTGVSIQKVVHPSEASTNQAVFVGEAGLRFNYQVTSGITLKLGYEVFWIDGVALAPDQIQETYSTFSPVSVNALGVDSDSSVLFHGVTAGLEFKF